MFYYFGERVDGHGVDADEAARVLEDSSSLQREAPAVDDVLSPDRLLPEHLLRS